MENWFKNRQLFAHGLLFVAAAYILIKLIDHYQLFFSGIRGLFVTIFPFLLAFIFAYIFNPMMVFIEKRLKCTRSISLAITYVGFILTCYLIISFIFPVIYRSAADLIGQIPNFAIEIQNWINSWSSQFSMIDLGVLNELKSNLLGLVPKITELLTVSISSIVSLTYSAVTSTGNVLLAFIISIYILLEKEKFEDLTKKIIYIVFRKNIAHHIFNTANLFNENIGKYLIGKAIDSLFVGVCAMVGLGLMGAKYAVLLGVIFGITNMVPFVGPIFGTLIAVGVNLFYHPLIAMIALVFLLIVQQVETLIIDPKVVGQKMGLNPFFTLLAVTLGGKAMGIVGMILGVPIMGVLKIYLSKLIHHYYDQLIVESTSITLNDECE